MLYKLHCLGRAGKAGSGHTELPSAASTQAKEPAGPNVTYSPGQAAASRTHPGLENCSQVSRYRSQACRIPKLFWFSYFLTCNDSSSFTSSFGGNKSLAWIYSKLGGPSSPCIANKTYIETGPSQQVLRKAKNRSCWMLLAPQYLGDPLDLHMEMPVLPPDHILCIAGPQLGPGPTAGCCRISTAQRKTRSRSPSPISSNHVVFGKPSRYTSTTHRILD